MSRVKPKVDVVAVVYSCYSNSGYVFNACHVMPFLHLCRRSAVYLTVPLSRQYFNTIVMFFSNQVVLLGKPKSRFTTLFKCHCAFLQA